MTHGRSGASIAVTGFLARTLGAPILRTSQRMRRDQLDGLTPPPDSIVLLGDSITEQGEWQELLPQLPLINRGIGGETSEQVLGRLGAAIHRPAAVNLLIGTNDLSLGTQHSRIAANVSDIIDEIQRLAPTTPVILNSVMPRSPKFATEIRAINRRYKQIADARPEVRYLDLWEALAAGDRIRPDYSFDNLHLTGAGYRAWTSELEPTLHAVPSAPRKV